MAMEADFRIAEREAFPLEGRISFVLHQNLHVKRVQFLDVYKNDNAKGENPHEQFDIAFALMTGELSQLLAELTAILGGEQAVAEKKAA